MPEKDRRKKPATNSKQVSVDPLYESTDKYRVVKPFEVEEVFSSTPFQTE